MSKPLVDAASDDEFQDALSDVINDKEGGTTSKEQSNEKIVEELIEEIDLNANDDDAKLENATDSVDFNAPNDQNDVPEYFEEDIDEAELREAEKLLTEEDIECNKEKAHRMKLEGNELFKNDKSEDAIIIYTKALKICPTIYPKERAVLYGNRAAAKIKLDCKKAALLDCSQAIELWPDYVRVLIRRAKLYENEDKLDLALEDYKRVIELDPGHPDAREACVRLPPIVNERNEKLKEEMMGKFKDIGNLILKPFGLSTANFQMQQDPNTGSYSINFNQKE